MTDPISDMLTRIRNAGRALRPVVEVPHSQLKERIAHILKKEGYVAEVAVEGTPRKQIRLKLKYEGKRTVIEGLRRYVGATEIAHVRGGLGVSILSTSQGVMSGAEARKKNLGGELLCHVW